VAAKHLAFVVVGAVLLVGSAAMAADYRPDEFLGLDLSRAVLSPNPLGPPTQFAPVGVAAGGGLASNAANEPKTNDKTSEPKWARDDLKAEPKKVATQRVATQRLDVPRPSLAHANKVAHARVGEPRGAARTRLAHRHGSPLDAQAFDTRIQSWPCRSGDGGICNWKQ